MSAASSIPLLRVVDSHTEGEPTRVVVDGLPALESRSARARLEELRARFDSPRSALVREPRGFEAMVGAYLLEPEDPGATAQVVFFNNVGYLGMCVHGTIGVVETLRHLGRLTGERGRLETPVGDVRFALNDEGGVAVDNVESYRTAHHVAVETASHGRLHGDVAWGGNWFFLCDDHGLELDPAREDRLRACTQDLRASLVRAGIRGEGGEEIDHIELFGPAGRPDADGRNYVLCPGGEYDRSPCGTGTSAKLACLAADGRLDEGESWRQESLIGTRFVGTVRRTPRGVLPTVSGRAWITAEASSARNGFWPVASS